MRDFFIGNSFLNRWMNCVFSVDVLKLEYNAKPDVLHFERYQALFDTALIVAIYFWQLFSLNRWFQ